MLPAYIQEIVFGSFYLSNGIIFLLFCCERFYSHERFIKYMTVSQKMGSSGGSEGKESACRAGHPAFLEKQMATHARILAWRIPMDGGAWPATVHGIVKSQDREKYQEIFLKLAQKEFSTQWIVVNSSGI